MHHRNSLKLIEAKDVLYKSISVIVLTIFKWDPLLCQHCS